MIEARTLWDLIAARARLTPAGLLALDEKGNELSFGGLRDRALETAAGLHALGIERVGRRRAAP